MTKIFKRSNLEKQVTKLPQKVIWCKSCTMSNQRPKIIFNDQGICSGCINNANKEKIDWKERERELQELLNQHRKNDGSWDVLVPSSGGKDSIYVAHQLKYKYNMNPLTVTWSPLEYTDIGWINFKSAIKAGFTNILCTPDGVIQRKLSRLCFEELGDAFHTFVLGQQACPFKIAKKFKIKLVFYGENGGLEYAGADAARKKDRPFRPVSEFKNQYFKGVTFKELIEFGVKNKDYLSNDDIKKSDLSFYEMPSNHELEEVGIKGEYFYSYFKKWNPQENFYYATEKTGFSPNPERTEGTYSKYASLDDKMDGMHYYMRYIKFGLGRCTEDTAHEIRAGHLTRVEALKLIEKYEGEFPKKYFKDFLNYLDITETHFWQVVDSWRSKDLWKFEGNSWKLKYPIK